MYNILYYDGGNTAKRTIVEEVLTSFSLPYRCIEQDEMTQSIGALFEAVKQGDETQEPIAKHKHDLMMLHDIDDETIQKLSDALRQNQAHVERKAMLTKHNITWRFIDLLQEIEEEHAYFMKYDEIKQEILNFQSRKEEAYTKPSWQAYQMAIVQGYACLQERGSKEQLDQAMQDIQIALQHLQTR